MQAAATSAAAVRKVATPADDSPAGDSAEEAGDNQGSATWDSLVHQDSTASVGMDPEIVAMREDSVALAHRRLGDRLYGANDSVALHRKRLNLADQPRGAPAATSDRTPKKESPGMPGVRGALRSLSATIKGILPGERRSSSDDRRASTDQTRAEERPSELRRTSVHFADEDALPLARRPSR